MTREFIELTPLQKHLRRYSDKYMNNAMLDAIYNRILCYECGKMIFLYDPEDERYIKCSCGARKRVPQNIAKFTPDWGNEKRRRDGFNYLFQSSASLKTEEK